MLIGSPMRDFGFEPHSLNASCSECGQIVNSHAARVRRAPVSEPAAALFTASCRPCRAARTPSWHTAAPVTAAGIYGDCSVMLQGKQSKRGVTRAHTPLLNTVELIPSACALIHSQQGSALQQSGSFVAHASFNIVF